MCGLIKVKREGYYLTEPVNCAGVVSNLENLFREYAMLQDLSSPEDPHQPLGGSYSRHHCFKWEFNGLLGTEFSFRYNMSTLGSVFPGYDYKNIGGILVFPENTDVKMISEIDSLLSQAKLSKDGKITEIIRELAPHFSSSLRFFP